MHPESLASPRALLAQLMASPLIIDRRSSSAAAVAIIRLSFALSETKDPADDGDDDPWLTAAVHAGAHRQSGYRDPAQYSSQNSAYPRHHLGWMIHT